MLRVILPVQNARPGVETAAASANAIGTKTIGAIYSEMGSRINDVESGDW